MNVKNIKLVEEARYKGEYMAALKEILEFPEHLQQFPQPLAVFDSPVSVHPHYH